MLTHDFDRDCRCDACIDFRRREREAMAAPVYIAEPIATRMLALQAEPPPDGDSCPACGDFRHLGACAPVGAS